MHGFLAGKARKLKKEVFRLIENKPYLNETVVTIYPTKVKDKDNHDQPFIRVINFCQTHTEEIMEILKTLELDIEHLMLKAYIPKKDNGKENTKLVTNWKGEFYYVEIFHADFMELKDVITCKHKTIERTTFCQRRDGKPIDTYEEIERLIRQKRKTQKRKEEEE